MKHILVGPIISEKTIAITPDGKYVFEVNKKSNKQEIKKAINQIYNVKVKSANIINIKGKAKRFRGKNSGTTKNWKKAIITLLKGQKIAEFEIKK